MTVREMTIADYDEVYAMWNITTKRALCEKDTKDEIEKYLIRNKGLSQVAVEDGKIVGTVLAGHDCRRGFIHHMAVLPDYRRKGIAHVLADTALKALKLDGIDKTHIFCFCDNSAGQAFWTDFGFEKRDDIYVFSYKD